MQLIGMLDSPYVRRVAVSLQLLGLRFTHQPISVFSGFEQFRRISPVVKAPSLVCADGTVLLDSTLILDHAESIATGGRSLMPRDPASRLQALRVIGLALAACEKSVQIIYERNLRPVEKQFDYWLARLHYQLNTAYAGLEAAVVQAPPAAGRDTIDQAGITAAVAWKFTQVMLPEALSELSCPALERLSGAAEELPEFKAAPHGSGTCRAGAA
jgi:glutathione S-transferase